MNVITKVSDLSIQEFQSLIRKTILETLNEFSLREIDTEEQDELEAMFGTDPGSEKAVYEREIQL
jgi:hypothetical protein